MSYIRKPSSLHKMEALDLEAKSNLPVIEEADLFGCIKPDWSCCDDFVREVPLKFVLKTHFGDFLIKTEGATYIRYAVRLTSVSYCEECLDRLPIQDHLLCDKCKFSD